MGIAQKYKQQGRGKLFALLAILALVLSNLVPSGFMPARTADGAIGLVICTGYGPLTLKASGDLASHPVKGDTDRHHDKLCSFASHGAPATPASVDTACAALVQFSDVAISRPAPGLKPGRGMVAPPPPSRAPPQLQA